MTALVSSVADVRGAETIDSGNVAQLSGRRIRAGRGVFAVAVPADVVGAAAAATYLVALHAAPVLVAVALACAWTALVRAVESPASLLNPLTEGARAVVRAASVVALGSWALAVGAGSSVPGLLLDFTVVAAVTTLVVRTAPAAWRRTPSLQTLVVGDADEAGETCEELATLSGGRLSALAGCTSDQLPTALETLRPDAVLVLPSRTFSGRAVQRIAWDLESLGIPLLVRTGLSDVTRRRCGAARVGQLNLLHLTVAPRRGGHLAVKEVWERASSAAALVLLLPVLVAVAVAIKCDSPGPVLFRQTRVGLRGGHFTMWKFRTMRTDAEQLRDEVESHFDEVLFKHREDPRVTRVGRILRRYSVDELPQLVNVVLGHMALIGPRPALPEEVAAYDGDMRRRLAVKPGITGLWQVSGRSDLPWRETVRLDLDYVDNWSISRDLAIAARTVRAVVDHRGAY
jgi:exopolysaccharide biosynthesis polyprenyl glycosylphosphotransferase